MKTQLITAALVLSASLLPAQSEQQSTTVRVKKITSVNGKETVSDTTYTVHGPYHLLDIDHEDNNGKPVDKKQMVIMTDKLSDDEEGATSQAINVSDDKIDVQIAKVLKEAGLNDGSIDAQVAQALKEAGVRNTAVKRTLVVNKDVKSDGKKGTATVKVTVITNVKMSDPSDNDRKALGKATALPDNKLPVDNMNFYPNPGNGKFNLRFNLESKGATSITVMSLDGKVVYSEQLSNFTGSYDKEIDISQNPKGVYFVKIEQGGHAQLKKIVLE